MKKPTKPIFIETLNKIFSHKYFPLAAITLLLIIGLILRIRELHTDFWYDEAFTGIVVKQNWGEMFETIRIDRVHPPTFYIIVKLWTYIFGSSETAIRSIVLIFGLSLIPGAYWFFTTLEKNNVKAKFTGLCAATLLTISPFFVAYSAEARSYSFLAMIGLFSAIAFFNALFQGKITEKPKSIKPWIIWVLLVLLIVGTHYFSVLILVGYGLTIMLKIFQEKGFFEKKYFWAYFWGTLFAIMVAVIVIVNKTGLYQLISTGSAWWIPSTDFNTVFRSITSFLFGVGKQIPGIPPYSEISFPIKSMTLAVIVLITSIMTAATLWNKYRTEKNEKELTTLYTLSAMTFAPLLAFTLTSAIGLNTLVERYAIIYGVFFFLWLTYVWSRALGKGTLTLIAIYIAFLCFVIHPKPLTIYTELKNDINDVISTETTKHDQLIMQDPTDFVLMEFYIPDEKNIRVILPSGGDYSSWAVIKRSAELHSYKDCVGTCIYAINKVWVTDALTNDPNAKLVKQSENFNVYIIEESK